MKKKSYILDMICPKCPFCVFVGLKVRVVGMKR